MPVDVRTEAEIDRPRREVAAYAADPDNATAWYENIKSVEWKTERPLAIGSRIGFVATFLGVTSPHLRGEGTVPAERLVMRTTNGPFAMETTYTWRTHLRARPGRSCATEANQPVSPSSPHRSWRKRCVARTKRIYSGSRRSSSHARPVDTASSVACETAVRSPGPPGLTNAQALALTQC